jgi:class 3 adenylate cyclase
MDPLIQYTRTTDDVDIAWWSLGQGRPIVQTPLVPFSHIELEWRHIEMRRWYERLAGADRLVRYDGRSTGLSQRGVADVSLEAHVRDLEAVVERLGPEPITLIGVFHSGPAAITLAARDPEKVAHLVLWCTYAAGPDYWGMAQAEGLRALRRADYQLFLRTGAHELFGWAENDESERFAAIMREAATPDDADRLIAATREVDVTDLLARVACPTLVVHRRDLRWLELGLSRRLAARTPGARLVVVDGRSPLPAAGEIEPAAAVIDELLGRTPPRRAAGAAAFRAVLFTDVVEHTRLMAELGDARGRDVLRAHERITRELLRAHAGTEVKTLGDGFLAFFASVTQAVECAVALQLRLDAWRDGDAADRPPLRVRVGVHAGEPVEEDGDLFGASVILASRIPGLAGPGEILVSQTVKELCAGKPFVFRDRGAMAAKGFDEPVRVSEVGWR